MRTKDKIRAGVWALMKARKVARFPGADGRIPNFVGAERCAALLAETAIWKKAKTIKANPDSPQSAIRRRALEDGKTVYMAVPRLRSEKPFIELDPHKLRCSPRVASSIKGAKRYGRPVTLVDVPPIDLIICGSVAVDRRGGRIGKGGGYSDLEFALLVQKKKIGRVTPIVTSVHPLQILDEELPMTEHDIPVTAIITPLETIPVRVRRARPKGIYWKLLPPARIARIPVLQERTTGIAKRKPHA